MKKSFNALKYGRRNEILVHSGIDAKSKAPTRMSIDMKRRFLLSQA